MVKKERFTKTINKLFSTTAEMIYETDMQHGDGRNYWPFHPVFLDSLVAPFVFEELYRLFKILEKRGYSIEKIASIVKSPTRIANYQYLWPIKTLKLVTLEKKKYLAKMFVKLLQILRNNEPYCENFWNQVWTSKETEEYLKKNERYLIKRTTNPEMAKLLAKFEGLLMSYCEMLYYYMLDFSRMVHGPYHAKNKVIFTKEFLDLKAGAMWDLVQDFPFNHFQEVGIYPKEMQIQVFFMGHTHAQPSFPEVLEGFILKLDGKPIINYSQLKKYYQKTSKVVNRAMAEMSENSQNKEFLLKRGLDLFFYPLKPLYEKIGENWQNILPEVYKFAEKNKAKIKIPNPWGDWSKEKAVDSLIKQMKKQIKI